MLLTIYSVMLVNKMMAATYCFQSVCEEDLDKFKRLVDLY